MTEETNPVPAEEKKVEDQTKVTPKSEVPSASANDLAPKTLMPEKKDEMKDTSSKEGVENPKAEAPKEPVQKVEEKKVEPTTQEKKEQTSQPQTPAQTPKQEEKKLIAKEETKPEEKIPPLPTSQVERVKPPEPPKIEVPKEPIQKVEEKKPAQSMIIKTQVQKLKAGIGQPPEQESTHSLYHRLFPTLTLKIIALCVVFVLIVSLVIGIVWVVNGNDEADQGEFALSSDEKEKLGKYPDLLDEEYQNIKLIEDITTS